MQTDSVNILREALDTSLELIQRKLRRGRLTADDLRAILNAITAGGGVSATISDLADFFGTSEVNVRSVIKRRFIGKPRRQVYYDFLKFYRIVPDSWRGKLKGSRSPEHRLHVQQRSGARGNRRHRPHHQRI